MRFRRHREAADAATLRLLLGFAVVVIAVIAAVNAALAMVWKLSLPMGIALPRLFFETNTVVVLGLVLGGCWVESARLREGGAHVARLARARPAQPEADPSTPSRLDASSAIAVGGAATTRVTRVVRAGPRSAAAAETCSPGWCNPERERELVQVVEELSLASRMKAPAAWVVADDLSINAFAAGWSEDDAVVAVTRGALERLNREELQGIVGHELGHLCSGDTRLHMRLIGLVWGLQMVHGLGQRLMERDERGRHQATVLVGLALWAVGWLGWLGGRLLQASVSRQREFHADAAAVQFTRQVSGLSSALRKISSSSGERSAAYAQSMAHLWVAPTHRSFGLDSGWLSTHPPVAERLRRLHERALSGPGGA